MKRIFSIILVVAMLGQCVDASALNIANATATGTDNAARALAYRRLFEERLAPELGGKGAWDTLLEKLAPKIGYRTPPGSLRLAIAEVWSAFLEANAPLVERGNTLIENDLAATGSVSLETRNSLSEIYPSFAFSPELVALIEARTADLAGAVIARSSGRTEDSYQRNLAGILTSEVRDDKRAVVQAVREVFKDAVWRIWLGQNKDDEAALDGLPRILTPDEGLGLVIQSFLRFDAAGTAMSDLYRHVSVEAVVGDADTAVRPVHANVCGFLLPREGPGRGELETNPSYLDIPHSFRLKGTEYSADTGPDRMREVLASYPRIHGIVSPVSEAQAREVVRVSLALEEEIGVPLDIEWGFLDGELYIVQMRPIIGDFSKPLVEPSAELAQSAPAVRTPIALGQTPSGGITSRAVYVARGTNARAVAAFERDHDTSYIRIQYDAISAILGRTTRAVVLVDPWQGSRQAHNVNVVSGRLAAGEFVYANGPVLQKGLAESLDFEPVPGHPGIFVSAQEVTYFADGLRGAFYVQGPGSPVPFDPSGVSGTGRGKGQGKESVFEEMDRQAPKTPPVIARTPNEVRGTKQSPLGTEIASQSPAATARNDGGEVPSPKLRVLLVEEGAEERDAFEETWKDDIDEREYDLVSVGTSDAALQALEGGTFDLIICNDQMAGRDQALAEALLRAPYFALNTGMRFNDELGVDKSLASRASFLYGPGKSDFLRPYLRRVRRAQLAEEEDVRRPLTEEPREPGKTRVLMIDDEEGSRFSFDVNCQMQLDGDDYEWVAVDFNDDQADPSLVGTYDVVVCDVAELDAGHIRAIIDAAENVILRTAYAEYDVMHKLGEEYFTRAAYADKLHSDDGYIPLLKQARDRARKSYERARARWEAVVASSQLPDSGKEERPEIAIDPELVGKFREEIRAALPTADTSPFPSPYNRAVNMVAAFSDRRHQNEKGEAIRVAARGDHDVSHLKRAMGDGLFGEDDLASLQPLVAALAEALADPALPAKEESEYLATLHNICWLTIGYAELCAGAPFPRAETRRAAPDGRFRILVVDDSSNERENLERAFSNVLSDEEYEIVYAASVGEALEALEGGAFDAISTDVSMPGFDNLRPALLEHGRVIVRAKDIGSAGDLLAAGAIYVDAMDDPRGSYVTRIKRWRDEKRKAAAGQESIGESQTTSKAAPDMTVIALVEERHLKRERFPDGHLYDVAAIAVSPDGTRFVTGSDNGSNDVTLWDAVTGELIQTFSGHTDRVAGVAFSPDGSRILSVSDDGTARMWDIATGGLVWTNAEWRGSWGAVAFNRTGTDVAIRDGGAVYLCDAGTGKRRDGDFFYGGPVPVAPAFSPDGRYLLTTSGERAAMVRLLDQRGDPVELDGHDMEVSAVAYHPDGALVATGSYDESVRLWDAATGMEMSLLEPDGGVILALAFSPDGNYLAVGTERYHVLVYDVASGRLLQEAFCEGGAAYLAFSPDGERIYGATCGSDVVAWKVMRGEALPAGEKSDFAAGMHGKSPSDPFVAAIVEDNPPVMEYLERRLMDDLGLLREDEGRYVGDGYELHLFYSGNHAQYLMREASVDLLIVDWRAEGVPVLISKAHRKGVRRIAISGRVEGAKEASARYPAIPFIDCAKSGDLERVGETFVRLIKESRDEEMKERVEAATGSQLSVGSSEPTDEGPGSSSQGPGKDDVMPERPEKLVVLCIQDEPDFFTERLWVDDFRAVLGEDDYEFVAATDIAEALRKVGDGKVDICVADRVGTGIIDNASFLLGLFRGEMYGLEIRTLLPGKADMAKEVEDGIVRHFVEAGFDPATTHVNNLSLIASIKAARDAQLKRYNERLAAWEAARDEGPESDLAGRLKVLYVDPDHRTRSKLGDHVLSNADFVDLVFAEDSDAAQELIEKDDFDLVISDVKIEGRAAQPLRSLFNAAQRKSCLSKHEVALVAVSFMYGTDSWDLLFDEDDFRQKYRDQNIEFWDMEHLCERGLVKVKMMRDERRKASEAAREVEQAPVPEEPEWPGASPKIRDFGRMGFSEKSPIQEKSPGLPRNDAKVVAEQSEKPGKMMVLWIEDDDDYLKQYEALCTREFDPDDYTFVFVNNARDAMQEAASGRYNAAVCDIATSGLGVLARYDDIFRAIPHRLFYSDVYDHDAAKDTLGEELFNHSSFIKKMRVSQEGVRTIKEFRDDMLKAYDAARGESENLKTGVLIIEDDAEIVKRYKRHFQRRLGDDFDIMISRSLQEAVSLVGTAKVDVCFIDWHGVGVESIDDLKKIVSLYRNDPYGMIITSASVFDEKFFRGAKDDLHQAGFPQDIPILGFGLPGREQMEEAIKAGRDRQLKAIEAARAVERPETPARRAGVDGRSRGKSSPTIFVLDNSGGPGGRLARYLSGHFGEGCVAKKCDTMYQLSLALEKTVPDVVVTNTALTADGRPGNEDLDTIIETVRARNPFAKIVIASEEAAYLSLDEYKDRGVIGIVEKPFHFRDVVDVLEGTYDEKRAAAKLAALNEEASRLFREARPAPLIEKKREVLVWEGYTTSGDVRTRIEKNTRGRACGVTFHGLEELVDQICARGGSDDAVAILPSVLTMQRHLMTRLAESRARVIFVDIDTKGTTGELGTDDVLPLDAIILSGVAYLDNNSPLFMRLYRLMTGDKDHQDVLVEDLRRDPTLLSILIAPATIHDYELRRKVHEHLSEPLFMA